MTPPFSRTLHDLIREQAACAGDAPAVMSKGGYRSYADLAAGASRFGGALRAAGIGRDDRVGLLMPNRIEWIEACIGATAAGATVVPFSTWSTRSELDFLIQDSGIRLLIAAPFFGPRCFVDDLLAAASGGLPIWLLDDSAKAPFVSCEDRLAGAEPLAPLPPGEAAGAGDVGLVLYTSGSTSVPKAVPLLHHGLIENGFNIGERQGLGPADRVLLSSPLFWAFGSANALCATFTHGAALVLLEKFDAAESLEAIERERCTAIYTLPAMTHAMRTHPSYARDRVASLRTGVTIGSREDFLYAVREFGVPELCNIYGATETYGNCCVTWHHWPLERRARCQGTPLPGQELRIVDPDTQAVLPQGESGLLEVRGVITSGYTGQSAASNAATFTADGFYRTGDRGRIDADGAFVFSARLSEMIKTAGINVSPFEVEEVLLRHPAVAQVAVVGVPDAARGETIVAFVVRARDSEDNLDAATLIAHCRTLASSYKVPNRILFCDALPLTTTGKLQRQVLKQQAARQMAET